MDTKEILSDLKSGWYETHEQFMDYFASLMKDNHAKLDLAVDVADMYRLQGANQQLRNMMRDLKSRKTTVQKDGAFI